MAQPSLLITATFGILTVFLAGLFVYGVARAGANLSESVARRRRSTLFTLIGLVLWLGGTRLLAASGKLSHFDVLPPPLFRLLFVGLLLNLTLSFSRFGTRLVTGLPLWSLIAFQAFRIPVELALFEAHREGVLPVQMTFEGWNFDVLSGLSAIVVAWLAVRGKLSNRVLLVWNVASLALLVTIVSIAMLSAPWQFRAFPNGLSSAAVTTPGLVWLPTFLVPVALFGHLMVFRWLARARRSSSPQVPGGALAHSV